MVNELYLLGNALEEADIAPVEWNRKLKELRKVSAKTPCFRIWISKNASVHTIDEITDQNMVNTLRKWEPSNGNSFPAFNMPALYSFSNEQNQKITNWIDGKSAADMDALKLWCNEESCNWKGKAVEKLKKCLHDTPEQLATQINKITKDKNIITELIHSVTKIDIHTLKKSINDYLFNNHNNIKTALKFLSGDIQVIIDLQEWEEFGYPVAHEKTMLWINTALNSADNDGISDENAVLIDAFGDRYETINEPMPSVKLPGKVSDVKLRSMFHEHQCQFRYGLIDDASYPIGRKNRVKIKKALEWLKEPDKEGKTWGMVSMEEILFAYPSKIDAVPAPFASFLGASANANQERFETFAEEVIATLKGRFSKTECDFIQIFAIKKMDKARSKIVFYRDYDPSKMIAAAKTWQEGCANIPALYFSVWKDKKPLSVTSEIPTPLQIAWVVNETWKMDGSSAGEVKRVNYYQGIELLFDDLGSETKLYILHILLANVRGLVLYIGGILHSGKVIPDKTKGKKYIFIMPVLGLMLYKNNYKKEDYMENNPYLIGQILKVSDELHTLYCKVVRDGDIPPQLAGNSVFITASETPDQALSQLRLRMNPYISWAKQYCTKSITEKGKESWKAGWYLKLYEDAATKLNLNNLNVTRFNDAEKAQVFIGYLAAFPKKEDIPGDQGK
ncbi:MAG: hypothetical protein Ta2F_05910 [Termitinemataceae bacterium]|nr:MAG: hypothetical protein Ta2F_05910 [Termitinemataceae bacterium]